MTKGVHGQHRLLRSWLVALLAALGCAAPASSAPDDAAMPESTDDVSSTAQALSADPGPKLVFTTSAHWDRILDARSDGTHFYVRYWRELRDRGCWGRVLRTPVGGGETTVLEAPCGTRDFVIDGQDVYFAATKYLPQEGGIYRGRFGVAGWERLTLIDAQALTSDEDYLYWSDGTALHRVLRDGTQDEVLAADAPGAPPLLVDATSVYGHDRAGSELWKVPKQGGPREMLAKVARLSSLRLDGAELFFIDDSRLTVDGSQRIERLPVTGGTPCTLYATTQGVHGLAVQGAWVYWSTGFDIVRRARTGGIVARVDTVEPTSEVIGADATNVYYTRWNTLTPPRILLYRLPIADLTAPVCGDQPRTLVTAENSLGLAVNGTWVYYTEGDTVRRVWKNGGTVETLSVEQPHARALYADDRSLSWVTDDGVNTAPSGWRSAGALYAANAEDVIGSGDGSKNYYTDGARLVGPGDATLATGVAPYRLASDASFLYWTDGGDGTVRRVPLAGGNAEVLATVSSGELGDIALGASEVFFTVDRGGLGTILRVGKTGGATALVAKGAFSPSALEAAGSFLYFTSSGPSDRTVYRVAKSGGKARVLVRGDTAFELDTLGRCVYYVTDTQVAVVSSGAPRVSGGIRAVR